jgi:predicted Ser/Thr protein kinase
MGDGSRVAVSGDREHRPVTATPRLTREEAVEARDLFERALEREPEAIPWVKREVADGRVKAEVLSLLDHHSRAGAFLEAPVSARVTGFLFQADALEPGSVVGGYTIVRELGRGGMGCVYLANDARLGRAVALKAIAPHLTGSEQERERLRKEARAAAQLSHPGICTVYALEDIGGELFIASEFIDGPTLREEIQSGVQPSPAAVADAANELSQALRAAHAKGIVHRDLKPENVMRSQDGRLKILDFGLARLEDPASGVSMATQVPGLFGTPAYMAPEQLTEHRADARSDLFSFGVVMHEYACGAHPFQAPTLVATTARVLEGSPDPLDARRPDLAPAVVAVIERCLRKTRADRFQSAGDVLAALASERPHARNRSAAWWRTHQLVIFALYIVSCVFAWQIKEWRHGLATVLFLALGACATVGGVFRGHLVFTERVNRASFDRERARALPILTGVDMLMAIALGIDAGLVAMAKPLFAVFTLALGLGLALARAVLEPVTTAATFPEGEVHARD